MQSGRREQLWWADAVSYPLNSVCGLQHSLTALKYCGNFLPADNTKAVLAESFDLEMEQRYRLTGMLLENIRMVRKMVRRTQLFGRKSLSWTQ